MTGIRTFLFDIGNVLIDWNPDHLLQTLLPEAGASQRFRDEAMTWERITEMDRGQDWPTLLREIEENTPRHLETATAYRERWVETVKGPIEPVIAMRDQLRASGFPVYALSNYGVENFERTEAVYPFLRDFDGRLISGYEGLVKPDPAIYKLAIDRFGLEPAETLFIDDRSENINAAKHLGFLTHHFTAPSHLQRELTPYLHEK